MYSPIENWLLRLIEGNVRYGEEGGLKSTLFKNATDFCVGKNEAVVKFLEMSTTDQKAILFVGENIRSFEIYRYTDKVPTFEKISMGELLKTFQMMLRNIFIQLP
jgi:hypothetical protein